MDKKSLKTIKKLLIWSWLLIPISIVFVVISFLFLFKFSNEAYNDNIQSPEDIGSIFSSNSITFVVLSIFSFIILVASLIISIFTSIKILATKWENKNVENRKILWGILSLIIFPLLAPTIFYFLSKNDIYTQQPEQEHNDNPNK